MQDLGYNKEKIEKIIGAIISHSFTKKVKPNSFEAKILSDADKLDAIGAVGIYRAAMFCEEHERSIKDFITHFHEKLLLLLQASEFMYIITSHAI